MNNRMIVWFGLGLVIVLTVLRLGAHALAPHPSSPPEPLPLRPFDPLY